MADHLSRMSTIETKELPINDFLRDDMLLKVETSHPWYANIVNFMVSGYVPHGRVERSWPMRANATYAMHHIYTEYVQMDYYGDVYPRQKDKKKLKNAMQHHMEDIMVFFALRRRSDRMFSFGHQCI